MKHAHNFKDLTGKIFYQLSVLNFIGKNKFGRALWNCLCSCGKTTEVSSICLLEGYTKSCGCFNLKRISERFTTHGFSLGKTPEGKRFYSIWLNMKNRCSNLKDPVYIRYGGKGIKVCEKWLDFKNFKEDLWESFQVHVEIYGLKNTSLDRFPNKKGNYEPNNVRWATNEEQNRNKNNTAITDNYDLHIANRRRLKNLINSVLCNPSYTIKQFENYIGCTIKQFKQHIESQFEPWMNWDNHGQGKGKWEFDHIKACNQFDLSKEKNLKLCFNYTNLRPFESKKNRERAYINL